MKALKFIIPAFIAVGLLAISSVSSGDTLGSDSGNHTLYSVVATQAELATASDTILGEPQVETTSVADASLTLSAPPTQSEVILLNDPYLDEQWALSQIQAPKLWQVTTGSPEIIVAVLDTGIDQSHEDLKDKVVAEFNCTDSPTLDDLHGHGTHIAGIIAASSNNGVGIVGVAPQCRLMNVKVADDKGRCQTPDLAEGIIWAVDHGANVINISIEIGESSPELAQAVSYAWNHGAVIIAAAGNHGSQPTVYPACYENCIAVAAITEDNSLAPLSNYGDWVDVVAPGFNICSTLPDNSYGYKSGTSFATAYVSGLAALLFSVVADSNGNGVLNDEVRSAIETGCQEIGVNGVRMGLIDAANSLAEIDCTI